MKVDVVNASDNSVFESVQDLVVEMFLNNLLNDFLSAKDTTKLEQTND